MVYRIIENQKHYMHEINFITYEDNKNHPDHHYYIGFNSCI